MTEAGPPGYYDEPPPYDQDLDPSAPPAYEEANNDNPPIAVEGDSTVHSNNYSNPNVQVKPPGARKIYIVQMPHEPPPIVTIITPDLIGQYH
eukprot:CAMPEP_0197035912 /NCGR_PEP_ID=MMETSP1384-20130603/13571_1 /TAXON_ID=29189 /ORGANISM="Ammonia sp." /LENGTH=91 /DNA_ID=CAMNT_0042466021 /DNA_START=21 /DNA_END=293 /DNA_ORIENTATION=+